MQSFVSTKGRHDKKHTVVVNEVLKKEEEKKKGVTVSVRFQASKHMNQHMPAGSAVFCNKGKVINRHHCDLVSSVLNNHLFN